jgi:hypothetical protein
MSAVGAKSAKSAKGQWTRAPFLGIGVETSYSLCCKLLFHKNYSQGLGVGVSTKDSTQEPCFF